MLAEMSFEAASSSTLPLHWTATLGMNAVRTWERLLPNLALRFIRKRQRLFDQDGRAENLYILRTGLVKLSVVLADGTETVIALRFPGQIVEWPTLDDLSNAHFGASGVAIVNSEVLQIRFSSLITHLGDRELCTFIVNSLARDVLLLHQRLIELNTVSQQSRLKYLLQQIRGAEQPSAVGLLDRRMPLTEEEVANMLNISTRHLRRVKMNLSEPERAQRTPPLRSSVLSRPR
jgi:CRP-like cAMP-binding protein